MTRNWIALSSGTGAAYLAAAGLAVAAAGAGIAISGLATGVGLAALLLFGPRALPGVAAGAAIAMLIAGVLPGTSVLVHLPAAPLTVAAVESARLFVAWWLLRRVLSIDPGITRVQDVASLVLVTSVFLPVTCGLLDLAAAAAHGGWPVANWGSGMLARAFDDAVGLLLVVPAALAWAQPRSCAPSAACRIETALLTLLMVVVSVVVFGASLSPANGLESLRFALFPVVFWAAFRLGLRETTVLLAVAGFVALFMSGYGPGTAPMGLPDPHFFLVMLSITGLVGAAAQQQRIAAEAKLRDSEQRYRLLIENMNEGVNMTDAEARMVFVSERFCEMTGYSRDELLGRTGEAFVVAEHQQSWREAHRRREKGEKQPHPLTIRRKNGEPLHVWISPRPVFGPDGRYEGSLNIVLDMTAQRRAEEQSRQHLDQLAHVSRVSSMGEMASAIAHEINQPLTAIANYASASLRMLRNGRMSMAEVETTMERLAAESARAGEVVRKMRGFVRGEAGQHAPLEVGFVLAEVLRLAQVEARQYGVEVALSPLPELPPVFADSIQIQQVLLNLVRNGVEAINEAESERRTVTVSARSTLDGEVEISVADSGPGIPPDELHRVFDAFFTTKAEGIGIGLALSKSIVEAHGGRLWAESAVAGAGAVFCMTLPVAREFETADA